MIVEMPVESFWGYPAYTPVLAKRVPVIARLGNQQSFAKLKCQWAKKPP